MYDNYINAYILPFLITCKISHTYIKKNFARTFSRADGDRCYKRFLVFPQPPLLLLIESNYCNLN